MKIRALLAGLLCAMGLMFVTGCGDSPEKAFKEVKEGFVKGDAAKVKARVSKDAQKNIEEAVKDSKVQEIWKNIEFISCTENGDKATVKVKTKVGDEERSWDIKMVKEDGKWKMEK